MADEIKKKIEYIMIKNCKFKKITEIDTPMKNIFKLEFQDNTYECTIVFDNDRNRYRGLCIYAGKRHSVGFWDKAIQAQNSIFELIALHNGLGPQYQNRIGD